MKALKLHITLFAILICSFSFAQNYTNYTTKDGLPSNHVYTILQDAKGFMWFLTDKGMAKFNGKTFKTFTTKNGLPTNDIWDAFTTPDGKIWYFSKSTKQGYIENDSVHVFSNKIKDEIINPLFSIQIKDSVFPAGPRNTYKLKNKEWQKIKAPKPVSKLHAFHQVIHNNVGHFTPNYDKNTFDIYNNQKKLLKQFKSNLYSYSNGARGQINDSIYFYTSTKKYSILNLNSLEFKTYSFKDQIDKTAIKYPRINLVDKKLQITGKGFVGFLDNNFKIIKPYFFPSHVNAHFGFIDRQNTIWLSTFNKGIYKLPASKQQVTYNFIDDKIQTFNVINNNLLMGVYNKGYFKYNKKSKTFNPYIAANEYCFGAQNVAALNKTFFLNRTFITTHNNQKNRFTNNQSKNKKLNYIYGGIKKVAFFNSEMYGMTSGGFSIFNHKTYKIKNEIALKGCTDLLVFNSRLIIATTNRFKELINNTIQDISFKNENFNKPILSIKALSKTELLVNTDGFGSYITDLNTIKPLIGTEHLSVQEAYINKNDIWLATNNGVLHLKKRTKKYQVIRNYTINDGLPSNNINTIFVDDKELFVGTNYGLARVPINQIKSNLLLDLFVEKATYNSQLITSNSSIKYQTNATLSLKANAINFSDSNTSSFTYKLEHIQNQWNTTASNNFNFNSLKPDSYVFHVKSGTKESKFNFTIKPLWWQLIWFKFLVIIVCGGIIAYIFWRISIKNQEKKNNKLLQEKQLSEIQLKALRSQMNPHFVFNSLSAIQYYINNNEIEASELYLVKFSKLIRQFFELSKETEISINLEAKLIKNYLDIEKLRFKDKFEYSINIDKKINLDAIKLPTMLIQPIVENAINHGLFNKIENGTVIINFIHLTEKSVKVEIIDDGVGLLNTKKKTSIKIKSSNVLEDRLKFLNSSGLWEITYKQEELNPTINDKGHKVTFLITQK
ncbi:two component regulator with propeller domain [Lutibacter sp. Hel_I_33_5]|uniref:sensor histidine kinase n=1 Tax=Lutibacter sp. Hel_I_33_5 TaxID=1566289 RepID=UPI0011A1AFF2|nr:histidine kinase [Lutibacter sp. Hel_I_33_5]TVZ54768.1 two component regulator with propeller domain [Lutibacter sp. Hel_I_33_5]TVZ57399.1 two component regulator with propeller domain [Lutibacter sp. Hel_I_33_5]